MTHVRAYVLNERGPELRRLEEKATALYVVGAGGYYHLIGDGPAFRYDDDIRVALCRQISGRLGYYGVTDDTSGYILCPDCVRVANRD